MAVSKSTETKIGLVSDVRYHPYYNIHFFWQNELIDYKNDEGMLNYNIYQPNLSLFLHYLPYFYLALFPGYSQFFCHFSHANLKNWEDLWTRLKSVYNYL